MDQQRDQAQVTPFAGASRAAARPERRRPRWPVLAAVIALHVLAILGLARALAPDFTASVVERAGSLVTVTITSPPEPETPSAPPAEPEPDPGAAGEQGRQAVAREEIARPNPAENRPAPRATSTGSADSSGARQEGEGTGAGGSGEGTGSGSGGSGQGSGLARQAEHIAGEISNARDFPVPEGGREARIGTSVIIALTVEPDGRPSACRIHRSSGFPETDAVTCRLALERLRFRPATNQQGEAVRSTFYWQQRFFF